MRDARKQQARWILGIGCLLLAAGCASRLDPFPASLSGEPSLVFGRVHVVQRGSLARIASPVVRFFELYSPTHDRRFRVDVNTTRSLFYLVVPPGEYVLTRIQIAEGAFRGMARIDQRFRVSGLTYVGEWTVALAPPRYDRTLDLTVTSDSARATAEIVERYPGLADVPVHSVVFGQATIKARVWEIYPYPRFKYFLRHHPT